MINIYIFQMWKQGKSDCHYSQQPVLFILHEGYQGTFRKPKEQGIFYQQNLKEVVAKIDNYIHIFREM